MKKIGIILVCLLLFSGYSSGQSPQYFKYQAVVRDASGNILPSQAVSFKISIIQTSPSGTVVYAERHAATTNEFGMVNLTIGGGTVLSGSFSSIDWGSGPYFLKVEFDPAGGTNYTVMGTSQLLSVPYALFAQTAASTTAHYIGELYAGGIVFWVDHTGQHGLIVSLVDISQSAEWSNVHNVLIGPAAESTWNGQGNSNAIMGQSGHTGSSAKLCHNYTNADYGTGIYSDWYLPAIDQLCLINETRYILNKNIEGVPGTDILATQDYWSSTECWSDGASDFSLGSFPQGCIPKNTTTMYTRAVRAF